MISVTYLIFTADLCFISKWTAYSHLHCIDLLLLVHTAVKDLELMDLDLTLKLADLDLADAGLDTSLIFDAYNA